MPFFPSHWGGRDNLMARFNKGTQEREEKEPYVRKLVVRENTSPPPLCPESPDSRVRKKKGGRSPLYLRSELPKRKRSLLRSPETLGEGRKKKTRRRPSCTGRNRGQKALHVTTGTGRSEERKKKRFPFSILEKREGTRTCLSLLTADPAKKGRGERGGGDTADFLCVAAKEGSKHPGAAYPHPSVVRDLPVLERKKKKKGHHSSLLVQGSLLKRKPASSRCWTSLTKREGSEGRKKGGSRASCP